MPPNLSPDPRYDRLTIALHWTTAVLVLLAWTNAMAIDWFPKGPLRVDARSTHIVLGALLACVVAMRLAWRVTQGRHLSLAEAGALGVAAKASHWGLYALLVATLVLGAFNAWVRGESLFGIVGIPAFDAGNKALRGQVQELHGLFANLLLALAGLHACAALWHRYWRRDAVFGRMQLGPGSKR
jgi:cytochrome b561